MAYTYLRHLQLSFRTYPSACKSGLVRNRVIPFVALLRMHITSRKRKIAAQCTQTHGITASASVFLCLEA